MTETSNNQRPTPPEQKGKRDDKWRQIARYSGLGMEIVVAVIGMAVLGRYLDVRLSHEQPVLALIFSAIGVVYVFVKIFKLASDDQ